MKRKYYPIYVVAFFLVVISAVSFRCYQVLEENRYRVTKPFLKPMPEVLVPKVETVREMARLERIMAELAKPTAEKEWPVNLVPFGYRPVGKNHGTSGKNNLPDLANHSLSMIFVGDHKGFCIIDGRFYPGGSELPDGSRIVMVKRDRVLLRKGHIKRWIMMKTLEESFKTQTDQAGEPLS
ncbi:MAG: hypothetical protein WAL98_13745 [Desulfatiglandaceae bacterium]|jgi:hypothetical protein